MIQSTRATIYSIMTGENHSNILYYVVHRASNLQLAHKTTKPAPATSTDNFDQPIASIYSINKSKHTNYDRVAIKLLIPDKSLVLKIEANGIPFPNSKWSTRDCQP